MRKIKKIRSQKKEKSLPLISSISGSLSFLGGWQICHNLCLAVIALLSAIGITIAGMPFLFLTQYAIYFWSAAAILLVPTLLMYWKNRKCMSNKLILFNLGIVIASVPFFSVQQIVFWFTGGLIIAASIVFYFRDKYHV